MFISVVICTRNRCGKLTNVLSSLEAVSIPAGLRWEVLIVDNGSTDATVEVCKRFVAAPSGTFRYVFEGRKGKSRALNCGIAHARGDVYAFTDDDCVVDRNWLKAIAHEYGADPELACLGGRVELYNQRDKAQTIVTLAERVDLSSAPDMLFKPIVIGANMSFRREVFSAVGKFDVLLGPGSKFGAVAEDLDYIYRAHRKGFKVVYIPSVLLYHDHGRETDEEMDAVHYRYLVGRYSFYCKHLFKDSNVARRLYWDLKWQAVHLASDFLAGRPTRLYRRCLRALATGAMARLAFF